MFSDRDIPDSQENFKIFTLVVLEDRTADEEVKEVSSLSSFTGCRFSSGMSTSYSDTTEVTWCVWIVFSHHTQFKKSFLPAQS